VTIYRQARSLPNCLSGGVRLLARTILNHLSTPLLHPCQPSSRTLAIAPLIPLSPLQNICRGMEIWVPFAPACGSNEPARRPVIYSSSASAFLEVSVKRNAKPQQNKSHLLAFPNNYVMILLMFVLHRYCVCDVGRLGAKTSGSNIRAISMRNQGQYKCQQWRLKPSSRVNTAVGFTLSILLGPECEGRRICLRPERNITISTPVTTSGITGTNRGPPPLLKASHKFGRGRTFVTLSMKPYSLTTRSILAERGLCFFQSIGEFVDIWGPP
jgi:hypothetical protein